jgi:hypothetical protein
MKIDSEAKDSQGAGASDDYGAELAAYRAILQNLLLEVARETGAERLAAIRDGALGALSASSEAREQSAAIVQATFDLVAAEAGFSEPPARNLH